MTVTNTGRRIALLGVLALMFALVPLSASALTGDTALDYEINPDVDASDAVQTSALVAQNFDAADNVLIATSADFADALASGSLQGADSPLFFVGDALSETHLTEFERLGATTATILGGVAAVSDDIETELTDAGLTVERLEGQTRIETAIAVAGAADAPGGIFLARAFGADDGSDPTQAFADSLAAGGWSAANGWPILLTQTDVLTGNTSDYLESVEGIDTVTVIGGNAAVSDEVAAEVEALGFTVERIEHETEDNRFGTAVAIAEARGFASADDAETVIFAEGQSETAFIDGFAAASLSAASEAPILLTNGETVPPATQAWIGDAGTFEGLPVASDDIAAHLLPLVENEEGLADALGLALVLHMLDGPGPDPSANTGIIIAEDDAANTYTFQPEDGSATVTVVYEDDDDFSVDGTEATVAAFEGASTVGDQVTFTEGDPDSHALVNQAAADEGTVGNVDTGLTTFDIIEPVSGATISPAPIDYTDPATCDLYQVDGTAALLATFAGDVSEGDEFTDEDDATGTVTTCMLANGTVAGSASIPDTPPAALTTIFNIGNLGDDPDTATDDVFVVDDDVDGTVDTDQTLMVDGAEVLYDAFVEDLSDGDDASYERSADEETFSITNQAPGTVSGQSTEDSDTGTNSLVIATASGSSTETYADDAVFIVNGVLSTVGDFEAALTEGDQVTYTPADSANDTDERVTLTDQPLQGAVGDAVSAATTLDVLAANGTTPLADDLDYSAARFGGAAVYIVNGEEVTLAEFTDEVEEIEDGDKTGTIEVRDVDTALGADVSTEYRLDTMAS